MANLRKAERALATLEDQPSRLSIHPTAHCTVHPTAPSLDQLDASKPLSFSSTSHTFYSP
jgi:hypothetical protein